MGVETPEACWATHKRQVINLWNCCIWLVNLFESYDDARSCQHQTYVCTWIFCFLLTLCKLCLLIKTHVVWIDSSHLGGLPCDSGWIVMNPSKDCSFYVFRVKHSKKSDCVWTFPWGWRCRHNVLLKCGDYVPITTA
jgi:hypothetical protein